MSTDASFLQNTMIVTSTIYLSAGRGIDCNRGKLGARRQGWKPLGNLQNIGYERRPQNQPAEAQHQTNP